MDIGQSTAERSVRFFANNPKADDWMKTHCESIDITFELPEQAETAKAFKKAAEAAGLTISNM